MKSGIKHWLSEEGMGKDPAEEGPALIPHNSSVLVCSGCYHRLPETGWLIQRKVYAGQEAPVRAGHGPTDWFQIGKGVHQGCILSPCLFNLYAEYLMRNAGLEETQAGIKIARRNSNKRLTNMKASQIFLKRCL